MEQKRSYRFFFHYHKQAACMSVHFKKKCTIVDNIECRVPVETKWNAEQPRLVMQGFAKEVVIENNKAIIS